MAHVRVQIRTPTPLCVRFILNWIAKFQMTLEEFRTANIYCVTVDDPESDNSFTF